MGNGVPDRVQRPARKMYDAKNINSKMKLSEKGYKVVDISRMDYNEE